MASDKSPENFLDSALDGALEVADDLVKEKPVLVDARTAEEKIIARAEKQKQDQGFQERYRKVVLDKELREINKKLKVPLPDFDLSKLPDPVGTEDTSIVSDAYKLYIGGYTKKGIATLLEVNPSTITNIANTYKFDERKEKYTERVLDKAEKEIEKEDVKKTTKLIPAMTPIVNKMLERGKEYMENPDKYEIEHTAVFKQIPEWLKMYGKATGEFKDVVDVGLTMNNVYEALINDTRPVSEEGFKAELIEAPKLIE
ncbi:MAG: hypothetical protein HRT47_01495 [Candidatus Caenarcaniphilales bacterium]|nr:hypothetical protein [Candidatus Caenarcaniphilales bacterium]